MGIMKFSKDKAKKADAAFAPITEGEYELIVTKGEYRNKQGQTPNINLTLVIRSDVEQEHKGRKIFHTFWFSEKSEAAKEFCENMIMSFLDKIGTEENQEFLTEKEIAAFMVGKPVKGYIHSVLNNKGKEQDEIKHFTVSDLYGEPVDMETAAGQAGLQKAADKTATSKANKTKVDDDPFAKDGQPIDISDDDLPF